MTDKIEAAEKALAKAHEDAKRKDGWKKIAKAPKDGTKVHLWMEIYASPMSMGMGDSFAVPDCWWDGTKWVHVFRGAPAELNQHYITYWMSAAKKIPAGTDVWSG